MIKIFTTGLGPQDAGNFLTSKFEEWIKNFEPNTIEIVSMHTNSNKFGWMLAVHYKLKT